MSNALNLKTLAALREFDEPGQNAFITELITTYLSDTATNLEAIRVSLQAQDAMKVSKAAHAIKGSSLNMGADDFASLMHSMEKEGKGGILALPARVTEAEASFLEVKTALEAYLA